MNASCSRPGELAMLGIVDVRDGRLVALSNHGDVSGLWK